jgi:methionyl-tRNA formyltransferase
VLANPAAGLVNVHFSLLPKWRGAAPVERAILAGDTETGVSIMAMDSGLDTGAIISSEVVPISDTESAGDLTARLAGVGARLLGETLAAWTDGRINAVPQDDSRASYASKLTTVESRLSLTEPSAAFVRKVRAFHPRPGAHAYLGDNRFKVLEAKLADGPPLSPGHLMFQDGQLWIGTADTAVLLLRVQPAGKPVMDAAGWARGHVADIGRLT